MDYELFGWYFYEFAMSAFQYSILNFLPILITNQAKNYSWKNSQCDNCNNGTVNFFWNKT